MPQIKKDSVIIGLALFSMFFGAGNLTLPPLLGLQSGSVWSIVTVGFIASGVVLPILAIYAHAKLQGTMYDFAKRVSPIFSIIFCILIYCISVIIPAPRTASLTHEMGVQPYFDSPSIVTSCIYFLFVFLFSIKRQQILDIIGKYLTPFIVTILLLIIGIGLAADTPHLTVYTNNQPPFLKGFLEGYQTFDAIGGMLIGGVVIVSLNLSATGSSAHKKTVLLQSGIIAGSGLAIIYTGLIALGAYHGTSFNADITRSSLLHQLSIITLGNTGSVALSILVSLACFTTAVGIITGTADYFKSLTKSDKAYPITIIISCLLGVLVGQLDFHSIIVIAIPVLMLAYPITIILIVLNVLPNHWVSNQTFKAVVITTIIAAIPEALFHIKATKAAITPIIDTIPFAREGFGWFLPALLIFFVMNRITSTTKVS